MVLTGRDDGVLAARVLGQPHMFPQEEGAYLPEFNPKRVHLLLREVYGNFPNNNYGSHLERGVPEDAVWKHWR